MRNIFKYEFAAALTVLLLLFGYAYYDGFVNNTGEEFRGFEELTTGMVVKDFDLSAEGDIISIEKIEDQEYKKSFLENGEIQYTGVFRYRIRPQSQYAPENWQYSGFYNNKTEYNDYWTGESAGSVVLSEK